MGIELLEAFFLCLIGLMLAYLVRHYIFTLTVLRKNNQPLAAKEIPQKLRYEPSITVLIPACNEEKVIGRILGRLTEMLTPKTSCK